MVNSQFSAIQSKICENFALQKYDSGLKAARAVPVTVGSKILYFGRSEPVFSENHILESKSGLILGSGST